MNINRSFEILEISPNATYEEAKAAYRLMCQVWHPDKYNHSEKLYAKATSKIKEINAAWSQIEDYFKNSSAREAGAREAERQAAEERDKAQRAEQERNHREAEKANQHNQQQQGRKKSRKTLIIVLAVLGIAVSILVSAVFIAFSGKETTKLVPLDANHKKFYKMLKAGKKKIEVDPLCESCHDGIKIEFSAKHPAKPGAAPMRCLFCHNLKR